MQPSLSVVIPCLDAAATLPVQLEALAAQRWSEGWEVILADNGSTDDSREVAESFRARLPELRIVDASARRSQAYALNEGVRAAGAEAVAFCDADDEVGEGWVAAMGDALRKHELVACRQDDARLNEPWVRGSREPVFASGLPRLWFPPYLAHAGSGALGMTRALHEAVGGFDETMTVLFDTDFCIRAQLAGKEIAFVPEAVVHYRYRDSLGGIFGQARLYAEHFALLQRRYARHAEGRAMWLFQGWKPVVATLPRALTRSGRARLAWLLGWQTGRYTGSVRYRVLAV